MKFRRIAETHQIVYTDKNGRKKARTLLQKIANSNSDNMVDLCKFFHDKVGADFFFRPNTAPCPRDIAFGNEESAAIQEWGSKLGTFLDRYFIKGLGSESKGGVNAEHQSATCAVFFAKDTQDSDKEVAIKILFDESKEQFERELDIRTSTSLECKQNGEIEEYDHKKMFLLATRRKVNASSLTASMARTISSHSCVVIEMSTILNSLRTIRLVKRENQ